MEEIKEIKFTPMLPTAELLWNDPNFIQYRIYQLRRYINEMSFIGSSRAMKIFVSAVKMRIIYENRLQLLRSMGL